MPDVEQLLGAFAALAAHTLAPRLVGVGWATVDIERTISELVRPPVGTAIGVAPDDALLGARSWRIGDGPVALLLLEPRTEGRLAAALARRGEGVAAIYLAIERSMDGDWPDHDHRQTALGVPGRLLPQPRPWGPFVIQVQAGAPVSDGPA